MQEAAGQLGSQLVDLLDTDFEGSGSANAGWGRGGDDPTNGVDLCWDKDGGLKPLALEPLTEADQEVPLTTDLVFYEDLLRQGNVC